MSLTSDVTSRITRGVEQAGQDVGRAVAEQSGGQLPGLGRDALARSPGLAAELARTGAIADYVRARPWINPDSTTIDAFRSALPAGKVPTTEQLGKALGTLDVRFDRDYQLAPQWVPDAHTWQFDGMNGKAGDEGASYWLKAPNGDHYMAKVPPRTERGVNERVGYALHTALGARSNVVQFGQRDWQPLITLHEVVPGKPVGLNRVQDEIGLTSADYRVGAWPYPADNIGTGPSTWNRPDAQSYQNQIAPHLSDPAVFDKLHFIGHVNDDPDMKPGNILASVARTDQQGNRVYDITRIDFGIMQDGYQLRDLGQDLGNFGKYLQTLDDPINATYLRNVLPTMKQFASLNDQQLTSDLMRGIHHRYDGQEVGLMSREAENQMQARLISKRDMVRTWLEKHSAAVGVSPAS